VRDVDTRLEQYLDQGLTMGPAEPISLTVKVNLDVCNF
jgi:hypothetical protein